MYHISEHSFDFIPKSNILLRNIETTSLSLGTLQIEVSISSKRLLYVWGYHPLAKWTRAKLASVTFVDGEVFFLTTDQLEKGVSLDVDAGINWKTVYDVASGWIMISELDWTSGDWVRIADDCVLGLREEKLGSVYIHPEWY